MYIEKAGFSFYKHEARFIIYIPNLFNNLYLLACEIWLLVMRQAVNPSQEIDCKHQ